MSFRQHDVIALPATRAQPHALPEIERIFDIPAPLTRLIGREDLVTAIDALVREPGTRLVTLTGPGGIGKTRLAIATARSLSTAFDRMYFVPLVTLGSATQVADAIGQRIGLHEAAGSSIESALQEVLRAPPTLLVLDNMEHVIQAADLVMRLLQHCHDLHIIATSRVPLGISGEFERSVPALTIPDTMRQLPVTEIAGYEATSLFVERVRAFQPDFALDERSAPDIAAICARLDGLPLAIELAAARVRVLSPAALRDRLNQSLDILGAGGPDQATHQKTMRSTIAWSVDLLAPGERRLFRRLAVFAGSFDLEAVEAILGEGSPEALDTLSGLINQSLVRRDQPGSGPSRFRMLATIREVAREMLDASDDAVEAHILLADHITTLTMQATSHLTELDRVTWTRQLDLEQPNIQAVLQWLDARGERASLLEMLVKLQPFWLMRGQFDIASQWLARGVAVADQSPDLPMVLRSDLYSSAGRLALGRGDHPETDHYGRRGLKLAREANDPLATARALGLMAMLAYRLTDYDEARAWLDESLQISESLADHEGIAWSRHYQATITMDNGDPAGAEPLFQQAIAEFERGKNAYGAAMAMDNLSVAHYAQDNIDLAEPLAAKALGVFRHLGDIRRIAVALDHVGKCARRHGDLERAWQMHRESLDIRRQFGDPRGMAVWLEAVAALLAARDDAESSAMILGAATAIRNPRNIPLHGNEAVEHEWVTAQLQAKLGSARMDLAFDAGLALGIDQATELAIATIELAPDAGSAPPANPLAGYNLTPRETEILNMLVARLSDREIGEALFISPRTVARHVSGIFTKLDVHTRREAADLVHALRAPGS